MDSPAWGSTGKEQLVTVPVGRVPSTAWDLAAAGLSKP